MYGIATGYDQPVTMPVNRGRRALSTFACLLVALLPLMAVTSWTPSAYALTAEEIFTKSQSVNPGQDQRSKLTLLIKDGEGNSRKVVLRRFWKRYDDGPVAAKVLLFHEYPPGSRGTSFMVWSYPEAKKMPPDQWIYLPILRKVNKLPAQVEGGIQGSDLRASDMEPRGPNEDSHELLKQETIGSLPYYVVASTPKDPDKNYPYGRVVRWISADNFLIDKIDYYDWDGKLLKKQTIAWKQVGDAWVWQKVVIVNVQTGSQTTLNLTDIQVNQGLKESLFTERMMQQGAAALR